MAASFCSRSARRAWQPRQKAWMSVAARASCQYRFLVLKTGLSPLGWLGQKLLETQAVAVAPAACWRSELGGKLAEEWYIMALESAVLPLPRSLHRVAARAAQGRAVCPFSLP